MEAIILVFLCNRCHDTLGFLCMLCSVQHGLLLDFITLLRICRGYNSAVYGYVLLRGCGKFEFERTVYGFSFTSKNLLLDNRYHLSGLRIVVTGQSSKIVDSQKLP